MILRLILHPFLSQKPQNAAGGFTKDAIGEIICHFEIWNWENPHLADGGEFGEQHLEDWRWQRLLEYL